MYIHRGVQFVRVSNNDSPRSHQLTLTQGLYISTTTMPSEAKKGKNSVGGVKKQLNMRTKSGSSSNPMRSEVGIRQRGGHLRDRATIKRLNMYKGGKPIRNKKGEVIGGE